MERRYRMNSTRETVTLRQYGNYDTTMTSYISTIRMYEESATATQGVLSNGIATHSSRFSMNIQVTHQPQVMFYMVCTRVYTTGERMRLPKIKGRNAACITPSVVFNYTLRPTLCPLNYFHRFTPFSRVVGVMISKLIFISVPKIHHAHITPKIYIVPTITPTEQTTFQEMSTKYQCVPICIYSSCSSH